MVFHNSQQVKFLWHMSVVDHSIGFWCERISDFDMLERVDWNAWQEVTSGHAGFTNVLRKILSLSPDEIVRDDEDSESGKKQRVRFEQTSITLMKDLMCKFLNHVQLDSGPFKSTLSTAGRV